MITAADSRVLAERYLAELPRRWRHVQGVGHRAEHVAEALRLADGALVAAAWLHDIGYGPAVTETGFHPLDGARFLRRIGAGDRVARLVAHHSCAVYEARVRGFEQDLLAEFEPEESITYDAVVFCDRSSAWRSCLPGNPAMSGPGRPKKPWLSSTRPRATCSIPHSCC